LAFAFDCRIKVESASSGIEPQKVEPFFAAKLGAQNQTVRPWITREPVRIKVARSGQPENFPGCTGIGYVEYDDCMQLASWH
jgi:hypothetical protein